MSEHRVMIGLEVHAQLTSLKSKLFCSCSADYRRLPPNTSVCPVCLGLPGSLPRLNGRALEEVLKIALALHSDPAHETVFYRKHYFYPDMAKNFQISQYDRGGGVTVAKGGWLDLTLGQFVKRVKIRRVQLEEDVAKIVYPSSLLSSEYVMVDYNRAGVALCEMVTEPDLSSPREARLFIEKYASILDHLGVTDTSLEGSLRVDANISIDGGERVELKNINSPKDVEKALNYEVQRQIMIVERGGKIEMQTRHWDELNRVTVAPRFKEEEEDYRYFPESDLPPIRIEQDFVESLRAALPELPDQRAERFVRQYGLTPYQAGVLVSQKRLADFFEDTVRRGLNAADSADWLMNEVLGDLADAKKELTDLFPLIDDVVRVVGLYEKQQITGKIAKRQLKQLIISGRPLEEVPTPVRDESVITSIVSEVIAENPHAYEKAKRDPKAMNYLVGQVMKKTRARADAKVIIDILKKKIAEDERP
ncbi:Asp-tRNA(Asn)/Glu-tRNA(Gln) amidotransferase subunit GatB [Thermoproteati archaeon 3817-70]